MRVRTGKDWDNGAGLDPDVLYAKVTGASIALRPTAARTS
jgi:hypothetical protein